jgi:hypothetical protein
VAQKAEEKVEQKGFPRAERSDNRYQRYFRTFGDLVEHQIQIFFQQMEGVARVLRGLIRRSDRDDLQDIVRYERRVFDKSRRTCKGFPILIGQIRK